MAGRAVADFRVRWGSGPVAFELHSPDEQILHLARVVFDPWSPGENAQVVQIYEARWADDEIVVTPRPIPPEGAKHQKIRSRGHAVSVVEYAAIWQIVESCDHLLSFHGALLARNGKSVAIIGQSHAGKSTLAAALWQSGWDFLCDDLTIIEGRTAFPGPRRVSLRDDSRPLLGENLWSSIRETQSYYRHEPATLFQPAHVDGELPKGVELSGIVFLKRNGAATDGTEPQRLTPADAALALLPYTNLVRNVPFVSALRPVAELMSVTPAWYLPRTPLGKMVQTVGKLIEDS